jgi:hypothetical protein
MGCSATPLVSWLVDWQLAGYLNIYSVYFSVSEYFRTSLYLCGPHRSLVAVNVLSQTHYMGNMFRL